ncbi:MAG: cytochrome [Gemmatimonadaceae bacterium]
MTTDNGRRRVLGLIGPGEQATPRDVADAFEVAALAARAGWVVATGGRDVGVMDAASRGARSEEGIAIGVLPDADARGASRALDVAIVTGLGELRDHVVVLSSDAVVVCGMSPGTAAETSLAIQARKPLVLLRPDAEVQAFFQRLSGDAIRVATTPTEAMEIAAALVG